MKHLLFCLLMMCYSATFYGQILVYEGAGVDFPCTGGTQRKNDTRKQPCYGSYCVYLRVHESVKIELDRLWIANYTYFLYPNNKSNRAISGPYHYISVCINGNPTESCFVPYTKSPIAYKGQGLLLCKINGKLTYIEIETFTSKLRD